ncbi:MAG TPA: CoA transferase [Candidatus Binataceae bacterium]|nr:CoA transferase [Candidatus Binataceae bacterium]
MAGPLAGIRVVDLTHMLAGPMATMMLADQGADVIKVEPPRSGDPGRSRGRPIGMAPGFAMLGRNKRSVVIDLKQRRGIELLHRLIESADLFAQNFRPGTAERLGLGEPELRRIKPDLVYVSISGFGESGPLSHKRAYDPVIQAAAGVAAIQGDRASGRPRMVRVIVSDKVTALTAAQAMTAALFARLRTGEGQHVRLAMLDAVVSFLWPEEMDNYTYPDSKHFVKPNVRDLVYETADGYITMAAIGNDEWRATCKALGHPEWLDDPRFRTQADRIANADERFDLTGQALKAKSSAEWLEILDREQVPCAPILSPEQVIDDAQVRHNGLIVEYQHPFAGRTRQTRPAARFERTPQEIRQPAPTLGQHTDEVLGELGLSGGELARLRSDGVVA